MYMYVMSLSTAKRHIYHSAYHADSISQNAKKKSVYRNTGDLFPVMQIVGFLVNDVIVTHTIKMSHMPEISEYEYIIFTSLIDLCLKVFFHHLKSVLLSSLLLNNPP